MLILQHVTQYSRKSLRVLASVGEPINPSAWRFIPKALAFYIFILLALNNGIDISRMAYAEVCICIISLSLHNRWFFNLVGGSRCPISDTWWQTETGGFMVIFSLVY